MDTRWDQAMLFVDIGEHQEVCDTFFLALEQLLYQAGGMMIQTGG